MRVVRTRNEDTGGNYGYPDRLPGDRYSWGRIVSCLLNEYKSDPSVFVMDIIVVALFLATIFYFFR
jgi:hypothetical protein